MMKMLKKNKKGFTLIELIVVIAILAILAVIAIPRLSGFTATAKDKADTASMKTIETAIMSAVAANEIATPATGATTFVLITSGALDATSTAAPPTGAPAALDTLGEVAAKYLGATLPKPQNTTYTKFTATIDEHGGVVVTRT